MAQFVEVSRYRGGGNGHGRDEAESAVRVGANAADEQRQSGQQQLPVRFGERNFDE